MKNTILLVSFLVSEALSAYTRDQYTPKIHGGYEIINISEIPHHVTIGVYPTTENETFCEGSLLSTKFVLTAAVCFNNVLVSNYVVLIYFGAVNLNNATVVRRATKVNIHSEWHNKTLENNIAILEFRPVPLSDEIQHIRLPSKSHKSESFFFWKATVSGRGPSNSEEKEQVLQAAETRVIGNSFCKTRHSCISDSNICSWSGPESTCKGDEGGPLLITENDQKRTLIGVASFQSSNCEISLPSVFTRVTSYLTWIHEITSIPIRH